MIPCPNQWSYRWDDYEIIERRPFANGKFTRPVCVGLREDTPKDIREEYERYLASASD
jgi:hypothetical protein